MGAFEKKDSVIKVRFRKSSESSVSVVLRDRTISHNNRKHRSFTFMYIICMNQSGWAPVILREIFGRCSMIHAFLFTVIAKRNI